MQTDHKPLAFLFGPKRGIPVLAMSRLQRWSIQLAAYQYDIEYRPSKNQPNAHALSRMPRKIIEEVDEWTKEADEVNHIQVERTPITVSKIREATRGDPILSRTMMYCILHGWPPKENIRENLNFILTSKISFQLKMAACFGDLEWLFQLNTKRPFYQNCI